jgi:hypothetical protein
MTETNITITDATTPDGLPAFRIECTCTTHRPGQTAAIVRKDSDVYDRRLVHGTVLGVHTDPLMRRTMIARRKAWAA